jgi:hypothetical protein
LDNVTAGLAATTISGEKTASSQGVASSFGKHVPSGFGFLPTATRFDPTYFTEESLFDLLVPTAQEQTSAPRLRLSGEKPCLQAWGETEAGGVTTQLGSYAGAFGFALNGQHHLSTRNLGFGIASGDSYEDFHFKYAGEILAIGENKGADGSILQATCQAAVTATNVATRLLSLGLPADKCVVPVIGNTGICMTFGALIILDHSFPAYVPLSKRLDLSDRVERVVASAYLFKITTHVKTVGEILSSLPSYNIRKKIPALSNMTLSTANYFVKRLTQDVFDRGFGLFTGGGDKADVGPGVEHMIDALNVIYASPARAVAEYPLAVRTPDEASTFCYEVIYRDLVKLGYKTGVPDRESNPDIFAAFVSAIFAAAQLVHDAGVVHGDLYMSNVMWQQQADGRVVVKIVDWDTAHCLEEGNFVPAVRERLQNNLGEQKVQFGRDHDLLYLSVLHLPMNNSNRSHWKALASGKKDAIDRSFRTLLGVVMSS